MYYLANGLKTNAIENTHPFFIQECENVPHSGNTRFSFPQDSIFYDLDSECISLCDHFLKKIFPDVDEYYRLLPSSPIWATDAGHNSDFDIEKEQLERLIQGVKDEWLFRQLFYADCTNLIGYLQSRIMGAKDKFVLFYVNLGNYEPFLLETMKDGVIWASGEGTTTIFSLLTDLITNLYSILDITTKIAYQIENIPSDFKTYPRLKSSMQYGNYKQLRRINFDGTVFEGNHPTLKLIENLRHELIHNGYWEAIPKLYFRIENGIVNEKWIYMPDEINGNLVASHNRKRFFAQGIKINDRLPVICDDFWKRLLKTVLPLKSI